ncbi:hypothetical protein E4P40_17160 [Blastococcus sp. CT_GayMR20]|uniref:hypothetical protein n=1 Tax=Blastococcus sp. CT_GayMR20 TaxID=2559609 RepID=UPI001074867B|nr:hypothetical protein [Blastococcus sp. CT_GayMR20]TFV81105.1 hypothetical protein E4P40_17160 [Blastococcus sp. CT_GayMR20]
MDGISTPTYRQLLGIAHELGRADGRFAAAFEAPGTGDGPAARCLGRSPGEFARLLWGRADEPPAGLAVNAPLWYATGFAEGLAEEAAERCVQTTGTRIRRAFT